MERFRAFFDAIPDAVLVVNARGEIVDVSAAAPKLFGYEYDELIGQKVELLIPESFRADHPQKRARYFKHPVQRPMGSGLHLQARRKNGKTIPVEVGLSPLKMPEGLLVLACVRDITERLKLEQELRQAQKMEAVGRLAGGIAHDFNNILTIILGRSDLLLQNDLLCPDDRGQVALISEAAIRASDLTRQLLQFSRKGLIQPRVVNLNQLILATHRMLRRLIGEQVAITLKLGSDLKNVNIDPSQVQQVLLNLLLNARDALPGGGNILVETSNVELDKLYCASHPEALLGSYVMLAVSDTGTGMDADTKARIFEPFFTTKEQGRGTGLGLATVFGIVKQAGGHIDVYSDPGHGASFRIYLPESTEPQSAELQEPIAGTSSNGETILVVEDEDGIRQLLTGLLTVAGYTVFSASDGTEALHISATTKDRIHAMITDVVMPSMNGKDLATRIATERPGMKVLFMSGYSNNALAKEGIVEPDIAYLEKPWTPEIILRKLRQVLEAS